MSTGTVAVPATGEFIAMPVTNELSTAVTELGMVSVLPSEKVTRNW